MSLLPTTPSVVIKVIADGVTFNNSGQIRNSENSNNISNSRVSSSFNRSPAGLQDIGQVPNGFNDNLTDLDFAHATTNDDEYGRGAHTRQASATGRNSARDRFSGYEGEQRDELWKSPDYPPRFHTMEQPSPSQTASNAYRPPTSFNVRGTESEIHRTTIPESESNIHQAIMRGSTVGNHGLSPYPPNPPSQRDQRVFRGPLGVRHETYEEYDVPDSVQHHPFSGPQPTGGGPRKKARRSRRSRNTKAKTHLDSRCPSRPSYSPVTLPVPAPQCSSPSCSRTGSQSSPSSNTLNNAPNGTPSSVPYGQYWPIPTQHMATPAHYSLHFHPVYLATPLPFAHPAPVNPTVLSQSPEPHFAPTPVTQPVRGPAPLIQQPSEMAFRTRSPYYPDSHPNTPTRDSSYGPYPHTSTAAMHHRAAQAPDYSSSGNLPQIAAHASSWQHEGRSGMSMMPLEADSPSPAPPTWSSWRKIAREASIADESEPVSKRARRA